MLWEITCYNGEVYKSDRQELLTDFIHRWCRENLQTELNIKQIVNLH